MKKFFFFFGSVKNKWKNEKNRTHFKKKKAKQIKGKRQGKAHLGAQENVLQGGISVGLNGA